jgi:glucose/mannose transport system permease protein
VRSAIIDSGDPGAKPASWRWLVSRTLIYGVLGILALIYLLPALVVVLNAFRTYPEVSRYGRIAFPQSFSLDAFSEVWNRFCASGTCSGVKTNFYNSLKIAIPSTVISTALGAVNGYILSKWRFKGAEIVFFCILIGVFMPFQMSLLPWAYVLGKIHLYNSFYGLILIDCVQGISFTTLFCRNFFVGIPDDLVKAARIDGAGFWRIFWKIILPLSPPILIVTIVWQFSSIWSEFLFGMVFTAGTEQPITPALIGVAPGSQSAAVLIASTPPLLVFLLGGRYLARALTHGAVGRV